MPFKRIYQIGLHSIWLILFFCLSAQAATTLLPNGKQCFTDANGAIISGSVNMFFPATTTPKPTWQDSNQNTLNSQPIQLDSNGCAVIYGVGSYRQQVFDGPVVSGSTSGNLIFDQITTDTSAYNSVFWAGTSGGTPNVITIVDPGFNGTDGTVVQFIALSTNTGSVTVNPSSFGAISVVKDTTAGPIALTGGEINQNNVISLVYYATSNTFHLLNPPIQSASGATAPLCGSSGLKIVNDAGTPNSIIDITASQVLTQSLAGVVQNRSNVSTSINITQGTTTSQVGGMDGESPGTNAWVYIWLIDNGSSVGAVASAASGNGLTPNMPSGYTFKCRAGAMRVDVSGNLMRTLQLGSRTQYTLVGATNTATFPVITSGSTSSVMSAAPIGAFVPPTATELAGALYCSSTCISILGMNSTTTFTINSPNQYFESVSTATTHSQPFIAVIESTNVYFGSNSANAALFASGWRDSVNAN